MTATEHVILVDKQDNPIGTAEKLYAHQNNLCHRAFSIFILRNVGDIEVLLQQRASEKYHSPNLWTNTCCSHPRPEETVLEAANRRLMEEMGFSAELDSLGWFHYVAHFKNGLVENEIDHVLVGFVKPDLAITPNINEVQNYRWVSIGELSKELSANPEIFTPWLKPALEIVKNHDNLFQYEHNPSK
jgi:isopentenyl-diphosphate delta-isomerase